MSDVDNKDALSYRDSHKAGGKGSSYEDFYETEAWPRFLWERERMVLTRIQNEYFPGKDIHLLDFACGTGRLTGFLEESVADSVGVDVSGSMLSVARDKLTRTELIEADLTQDNVLLGRRFNLITAFRFFLNAEHQLRRAALDALVPLLSDDGYLVLNNHRNLTSPIVFATFLYNRLRRGDANFMFMSQVKRLVETAGLEIVRIYPVGVLPIPRLTLPGSLNHWVDDAVMRHRFLSFLSESPIVVCRRRRGRI